MTKKRPSLRDDSFLLIPASVIHDPRIGSLAEAAVFSLILGFSRKGELMRGGRAFVSEWTLLSGKWAGRILLSLEKKDLVRKVPLSQKGCVVRYGYYAEGFSWEDNSLVMREDSSPVTREDNSPATREDSSPATGEETSHRKYKGNNYKGKGARGRAYQNPFNDFEQHDYDFEELERALGQ